MNTRPLAAALSIAFLAVRHAGRARGFADASSSDRVSTLNVTILSTMLADEGFGEWGFAALVEVDGRRILFDTGANDDTVARNLKALGLDLAKTEPVVLRHNHADHTTGLMPLRGSLASRARRCPRSMLAAASS